MRDVRAVGVAVMMEPDDGTGVSNRTGVGGEAGGGMGALWGDVEGGWMEGFVCCEGASVGCFVTTAPGGSEVSVVGGAVTVTGTGVYDGGGPGTVAGAGIGLLSGDDDDDGDTGIAVVGLVDEVGGLAGGFGSVGPGTIEPAEVGVTVTIDGELVPGVEGGIMTGAGVGAVTGTKVGLVYEFGVFVGCASPGVSDARAVGVAVTMELYDGTGVTGVGREAGGEMGALWGDVGGG